MSVECLLSIKSSVLLVVNYQYKCKFAQYSREIDEQLKNRFFLIMRKATVLTIAIEERESSVSE